MFRKLFVGREVVVHASESDRQQALKLRQTLAAEEKLLASEEEDLSPRSETTILDFEKGDPAARMQIIRRPVDRGRVMALPAGC